MKRLYQKIYLTIVASLFAVVVVAGGIWRWGTPAPPWIHAFEMAGELAAAALPPADTPHTLQREAAERLARRLQVDLALYDGRLAPVAEIGRPLPRPHAWREGGGWLYGPHGPAWGFRLPDDRWIVVRAPLRHRNPLAGLIFVLGGIALVIAGCAYPFVRGLTRRLERLQAGVETLGAGNLAARVKVEGRDEVARLAESFNRAAARIEELVNAHRLLLANASHELRTPLSRIRIGLELFERDRDPKYKTEIARDIAELDATVDEILLASRLDVTKTPQTVEDVDLLALAAEEAARYDRTTAEGETVMVKGDARLLRRMIRNLLENAGKHGMPPVSVTIRRAADDAVIDVIDAGGGVPQAQRERVFLPFYRLGDGKGSGLGLALARQIARLHGGDVVVAEREGTQSCFRATLPV